MCYFSSNSSVVSDGFWHAICFTWSNVDGSLNIYRDNVMTDQVAGVKTGQRITRGGRWVLGQDQDSVGGGFQIADSFEGELVEVNVWGRVLTRHEIATFSTDCHRCLDGDVKRWPEFKSGSRGSVRVVERPTCTVCKCGHIE
jgi:hypothetical protein